MSVSRPQVDSECPSMVSRGAMTPAGLPGRWVIAEVHYRHEKKFAVELEEAGYDYFLPIRKAVRRSGRTNHVNYNPIIPGVVFCVSEQYRDLVDYLFRQRHVHNLTAVHLSAQEQLRRELSQFFGMILNNEKFTTDFVPGRKCRVKETHPYGGQEGLIAECGRRGYVRVPITTLGRVLLMEIGIEHLEPIG